MFQPWASAAGGRGLSGVAKGEQVGAHTGAHQHTVCNNLKARFKQKLCLSMRKNTDFFGK